MGEPAAKEGDAVVGIDTHVIMIPSPGGPVPTPTPMPFNGQLSGDLSGSVMVDNMRAAVLGSTASNTPPHIPTGGPFQSPPTNKATVHKASASVYFDNKGAARMGDTAMTCNDPADAPNGCVIAVSTIFIGS
jgi:uncharacterized Zn-binding protein involved in type VI secretion